MTDNNTFLVISPLDLITSYTETIDHVCKTLCLSLSLYDCFLCELPLILRVCRKKRDADICKGTLDIECERDWSVGLDATLGDGQKIKNYFSSFEDFSGESG